MKGESRLAGLEQETERERKKGFNERTETPVRLLAIDPCYLRRIIATAVCSRVNLSCFGVRGVADRRRGFIEDRSIATARLWIACSRGRYPLAACCCCSPRHRPCVPRHPDAVVPASVKDRRVDRRIDREGLLC